MKKIPLALAFLAAVACPAAAFELSGYVSAWTQDCSGGSCALPVPGQRNLPVTLTLGEPSGPGQAAAAHSSVALTLGEAGELLAELDFYALCPYGGAPGTCAGRYFQAQAAISGPAGAFCSSALNLEDFLPFPVLTCAGIGPAGRRFGLTFHRRPL